MPALPGSITPPVSASVPQGAFSQTYKLEGAIITKAVCAASSADVSARQRLDALKQAFYAQVNATTCQVATSSPGLHPGITPFEGPVNRVVNSAVVIAGIWQVHYEQYIQVDYTC